MNVENQVMDSEEKQTLGSRLKSRFGEIRSRLPENTKKVGRVGAAASILIGGSAWLNTACSNDQNSPDVPRPTPITTPSKLPSYGLTPTVTPTESIPTPFSTPTPEQNQAANLLYSKEYGPNDIPSDIKAQLADKLKSNISKIIGIEAQDQKDPNKKASFYFVKTDDKTYAMFRDKDSYRVTEYFVSARGNDDKNNPETHIRYSTDDAKDFLDFTLGGSDFQKKEGETADEYYGRTFLDLYNMRNDTAKLAEVFKDVSAVKIANPYVEGQVVSYSTKDKDMLARALDVFSPSEAYAEAAQKAEAPTPTPASGEQENVQNSVLEGLILENTTVEDLKQYVEMPPFEEIAPDSFPVPQELQSAYQSVNPENKILYVGAKNNGTQMNAVIVDKEFFFANDRPLDKINGFGYNSTTPNSPYLIGEFEGVVPIPGSEEFYFVFKNPINNTKMVMRANLEQHGNTTAMGIASLKPDVWEGFPGIRYRLFYKMTQEGFKLKDFIKPGDITRVSAGYDRTGKKLEKDESGFYKVGWLMPFRLDGYDELKRVLDK